MHLGDYALETTIHCKFTTRSFSTGAPTQLAGTPVVDVYEDNSTTQITAGETLTVDFDSVTGLNHLAIAATAANGYEAGKFYQAVITTGTVGGVSVVGEVVASFTIQATSALRPTTAGRTLDVSAGGEAGVDWANVGSPTTTVGLSGTTVKTATDVETDTADIQTRLPGALVSGRIDASVGAMAANVLTATAINADAITAAKVAADVSAEIADAVWDEDATGHQTGGTFGQAIGDPGADTTTIYQSVVTDAAGTNVAADIIAMKAETATILGDTNELQTDWVDGGRLDLILDARASQTSVNTIDDFLDTEIAAIVTAVGTDIPASIADLPTNAELATALGTADDAVLAAIAALNNLSSSAAATAVLTTQMTEAYAANGVAPTLAQALFGIHQHLMTFAISGTSRTVKKLDGSTTAFVETLDDATTPTALTRA